MTRETLRVVQMFPYDFLVSKVRVLGFYGLSIREQEFRSLGFTVQGVGPLNLLGFGSLQGAKVPLMP